MLRLFKSNRMLAECCSDDVFHSTRVIWKLQQHIVKIKVRNKNRAANIIIIA